ncbi:hypothetical protein D3C86_1911450 [compost metagenome]
MDPAGLQPLRIVANRVTAAAVRHSLALALALPVPLGARQENRRRCVSTVFVPLCRRGDGHSPLKTAGRSYGNPTTALSLYHSRRMAVKRRHYWTYRLLSINFPPEADKVYYNVTGC